MSTLSFLEDKIFFLPMFMKQCDYNCTGFVHKIYLLILWNVLKLYKVLTVVYSKYKGVLEKVDFKLLEIAY